MGESQFYVMFLASRDHLVRLSRAAAQGFSI